MQEQSFFHDMQARFDKIWPTRKKFHLWGTSLSKKKKEKKIIFTLFPNLYSPAFFQVWKIAGQITRLFQEFKTLYKPWRTDKKASFMS